MWRTQAVEFPKHSFLSVYEPRGRMKTLVEICGSSMVPWRRMCRHSFSERLKEIVEIKWNCPPAVRACMVRRHCTHGCGSSGIYLFCPDRLECPVALGSRRCANKCQWWKISACLKTTLNWEVWCLSCLDGCIAVPYPMSNTVTRYSRRGNYMNRGIAHLLLGSFKWREGS